MLRFYTNRELSEKLEINLAKWKRWSREFFPPDPLGGLQSGYARQYSFNDAFKLALGGHLVADLRFTIPEARQILLDLDAWLTNRGYYFDLEMLEKGVPPKYGDWPNMMGIRLFLYETAEEALEEVTRQSKIMENLGREIARKVDQYVMDVMIGKVEGREE